jgi:predicted transcriptional regulator
VAVLTVRMPDDRHSRLKELAASQSVSVNKMIEELTTVALVEFDTHNRFKARAARGSAARGLEIQGRTRSSLDDAQASARIEITPSQLRPGAKSTTLGGALARSNGLFIAARTRSAPQGGR